MGAYFKVCEGGAYSKNQYLQFFTIEKALVNDRLSVSKVSWKFRFPAIYNFVVIYPWNLLFLKK